VSRVTVRAARTDEAAAIAELYLRSRRAAPGVPPPAHRDDEVRAWLTDSVLPRGTTWVALLDGALAAMMVLDGPWIEQLYVAPEAQRRGCGTALLQHARSRGDELLLWTFEANAAARAFYEAHGFCVDGPADSDNEEGAPALRYRWARG